MSHPPTKYNPSFLSDEELIRSFVVRQADLDLILETIRENTGPSNQHVLVIGPRGIGKTMLLRRVAAAIRSDPDLGQKWHPLAFGEESYEVFTPGEFWLEAIFHLGEQLDDARFRQAYADLKRNELGDESLRARALALLMDFADQTHKRILLIVENLNRLLSEQVSGDGAWDLRHTLLNEPRLMLLGSATMRFNEIDNSGAAMFDLFRTQELEPLNQDECRTLWTSLGCGEAPGDRIRPIQILTGGSPRLIAILSTFAAGRSLRELFEDLIHLIDDHTEYFKSHLDALAPTERKVFVALAELWDPSTAREVARAARMDVNQTSSLLSRLVGRGAVSMVEETKRRKRYQLAERLYNIYYLMRRRAGASARVRGVVRFMIGFHEPQELVGIEPAAGWAARATELAPQDPECHHTLAVLLGAQGKWREALAQAPPFLSVPEESASNLEHIISFFVDAAATGYTGEGLKLLKESPSAVVVEPLIVGLQLFLGEKVNVAQEILEVGKDVAKRIRERQEALHKEKTNPQ